MSIAGNKAISVPIFQIYGGINGLRTLVAEDSNAMSLNDHNDVYSIITPLTTIVVEAGNNIVHPGGRQVYDLGQKPRLPTQPVP